ncbi:MAG: hypothetical protein WBD25_16770 [Terriglobales bacterium]|jgi:hypothetical protein
MKVLVVTKCSLGTQLAQKFLFIHAIFKSFVPIDEDHWDFVIIETPDFSTGVYIDFTPGETSPLVELDEALLDDFAEMTSFARINDDFTSLRHAWECSSFGAGFPSHAPA